MSSVPTSRQRVISLNLGCNSGVRSFLACRCQVVLQTSVKLDLFTYTCVAVKSEISNIYNVSSSRHRISKGFFIVLLQI